MSLPMSINRRDNPYNLAIRRKCGDMLNRMPPNCARLGDFLQHGIPQVSIVVV